jgi:hypothetical protein
VTLVVQDEVDRLLGGGHRRSGGSSDSRPSHVAFAPVLLGVERSPRWLRGISSLWRQARAGLHGVAERFAPALHRPRRGTAPPISSAARWDRDEPRRARSHGRSPWP